MIGIGGAPTRATTLPSTAAERKTYPIATGFFDYFPDAIAAIAHLSWVGNEQHNPGKPLHWDRSKSADEEDTALRHFAERGTRDKDGERHTTKFAWRALAILQKEIEAERLLDLDRECLPAADSLPIRVDASPAAVVDTDVVPIVGAESYAFTVDPAFKRGSRSVSDFAQRTLEAFNNYD